MYNLQLTSEQQEIRAAVREFVEREIKPLAMNSARLEASERRFPGEVLKQASEMGLRSLALSEGLGGAGADTLTMCIVAEELAAGDVNFAATLVTTSALAGALFESAMADAQRERFLRQFTEDDHFHLAYAGSEAGFDIDHGASYQRPLASADRAVLKGMRQPNGDWVVNGVTGVVANARVAKLIAADVDTGAGISTLLVSRETAGLTLRPEDHDAHGKPLYEWHHGDAGQFVFRDCHVQAAGQLPDKGRAALVRALQGTTVQAMNLGVGRAAYEAALEYAKLRKQGGRPIIEHQAIGALLAELAIELETARNLTWKAAWVADHPEARSGDGGGELPLQSMARVFTAKAMHKTALRAAEVFGATGVMRDMPLQKYVHDALVFVHAGAGSTVEMLKIAEYVAGYRRQG